MKQIIPFTTALRNYEFHIYRYVILNDHLKRAKHFFNFALHYDMNMQQPFSVRFFNCILEMFVLFRFRVFVLVFVFQ